MPVAASTIIDVGLVDDTPRVSQRSAPSSRIVLNGVAIVG